MRIAIMLPLLAALAGCGAPDGEEAVNNTASAATNTVASAPVAPREKSPEEAFADTVAAGDQFEVASGNLAQQKGGSAAIKAFGKALVDDHAQSTAKLKLAAMRVDGGLFIDPTMSDQQRADIAALEAASGPEFDRLFKAQQAAAHDKTIATLSSYMNSKGPEPLTTFAALSLKTVRAHRARIGSL